MSTKQMIQNLHSSSVQPKDFLLKLVRSRLESKSRIELKPLELDLLDLLNFDLLGESQKLDLKSRLKKISILSSGQVNPKTAKNLGIEVSNWILHLSPSDLSGVNICPMASQGCKKSCLNGAGRGLFDGVQLPRLRKTLYFLKYRSEFLNHLDNEVSKIETTSLKSGLKTIIRLNGTSDLSWELFKIRDNKSIFELHPTTTFYDYTKVLSRLSRQKLNPLKNYYLIFSASEINHVDARKALAVGFNVAIVFDSIPLEYKGFKVINGDEHDFRFLDKELGVIVGLKAKGPARKDVSGFVRRLMQIKKVA